MSVWPWFEDLLLVAQERACVQSYQSVIGLPGLNPIPGPSMTHYSHALRGDERSP